MNTDTINISIHSALSPRVGLTHQFFLFMIPIAIMQTGTMR